LKNSLRHIPLLEILKRIPGPVILALSFYSSSRSTLPDVGGLMNLDKVVHLVCFAGLAGAWSWYFNATSWKNHRVRNLLICILAVSIYGALDEFHQSFTPGREVSVYDWVADTLGAVLGSFAGWASVVIASAKGRK
jgi:hypothetical protein